ncbi:MAG: 50S ribosomal protein L18 [Dehalococcoidia bacterium]|nr:50S ribosomal protein L18 [Dehalococcoidia bacterium]
MITPKDTRKAREKRHKRIRARIQGVPQRPRLVVFRSLNHIYAQLVDDTRGHTLVAASTLDPELKSQMDSLKKGSQAELVGALMAKRALEKGITQIVFDRAGYLYHGRVKALSDGARKGGLVF